MEGRLQECPVCTLYLREGMSLRQHLETHPKEQVIDALVRQASTPPRPTEAAPASQPSAIEPSQMTTAVTYQQILTTNAAGTVVPQLLQIPMVNPPFPLPHNMGFVPSMFNLPYNPYVPQSFSFNGNSTSAIGQRDVSPEKEEACEAETVVEVGENVEYAPISSSSPPPPSVIISRTRLTATPTLTSRPSTPPSPSKEESVIVEPCQSKSPVKIEEFEFENVLTLERLPPLTPICQVEVAHSSRHDGMDQDCDEYSYSQHPIEEDLKNSENIDLGFTYADEAANMEEPAVYSELVTTQSQPSAFMELDGIRIFFNGTALDASSQKPSTVIQMTDGAKVDFKDLSPVALNIAADESMPARGELSEQESLGADSAWGMFQEVKTERWDAPRPFKCSLCEMTFACPKERRAHKSKLHQRPSKTFSCTVCAENFRNLRDRRVHMAIHSAMQGEVVKIEDVMEGKVAVVAGVPGARLCPQCAASLPTLRAFRQHMREAHGQVRFKCDTCEACFDDETEMNTHYRIHPLSCPSCPKQFYRRNNLNLHMKRHLPVKPFECNICPKSFITRQKLEEHTNGHAGIRPIKCVQCNKSFSRHSNLIQHRNFYHLKAKRKQIRDFVCRCGEVFHSQRKLEWHREIHDNKPKSCPFCAQKFIHVASVTRHVRRAHQPEYLPKGASEENVACPACDRICLRSSLTVHMRVHNGDRPFQCNICSKQFTTKWNMELHQWTHQSRTAMPFKCTQCKAAFFRQADYTAHLNAHKNLKPFICNVCGQKFIRKYNCLRHQEEHRRGKKFACTVSGCDRTFHRSYYLTDHMKVHTGERPHTCHICGKASSTKSNHNKHVRIHDTREPVNTEN